MDRVSDGCKIKPQTCFRRTKEKTVGNKNVLLTCSIAGFNNNILKQRLEADFNWVYMSRTPRDFILNSRLWDLSQKVFTASSLFAFHQFSDRKYFSFWEGLAAKLPSFPNICWNNLPFQKPKEKKKNHYNFSLININIDVSLPYVQKPFSQRTSFLSLW